MRVAIAGTGAVGARVARQVAATSEEPPPTVDLFDRDNARARAVAQSLGPPASAVPALAAALASQPEVVVVTSPGSHLRIAQAALEAGASVVSLADDARSVRELLELDSEAFERGLTVVAGAGFMPGLTCLLARHAAAGLTAVEEIHVAKVGTAGPACARAHHQALSAPMREWRDGAWVERGSGSGRELCWFPDPIGARDCYRAALADPELLHAAFPTARRVTARVAATRRDRVTSRLPMLRAPHAEGSLGAIRVEVRGQVGAVSDTKVFGAIDRPAVAAGCVAAVAALWIVRGRFVRKGAGGLADLVTDPVPFLAELADRGVRAAVFEGSAGS